MVRGVRECEARTHRKGREECGTRLDDRSRWVRQCAAMKRRHHGGEMQIPRLCRRELPLARNVNAKAKMAG